MNDPNTNVIDPDLIDDDPIEDPVEPDRNVAIAPGQAALEALIARRERAEEAGPRETYFPIPGTRGTLEGLFRVPDNLLETLKSLGKRVEKSRSATKEEDAAADFIAWTCVGVFLEVDGKRIPLEVAVPDGNEHPIRFDKRLTLALRKDPAKTARAAVYTVIPDKVAVMAFYNEVAGWMQDLDADDDANEAFVGESAARP